jgi:RimJ/RimL family protein N-acetyltransferase
MSKELSDCDIRYTRLTDTPYLRRWLTDPKVAKWFPMGSENEVDLAVRAWIGFSRYYSSLTATKEGVPLGIATLFLMPYKKVAHECMFKLIVDPEKQHQGVGTTLLRNLKHLAKNYFHLELMKIEIFEKNPIEILLKQQEFYEIIRQEKFVKDQGQYSARIVYEAKL